MNDKVPTVLTPSELQYLNQQGESKDQDNFEVAVDEFESGHGMLRTLIIGGHLVVPLPEADSMEKALVLLKLQVLSKTSWFSGITSDLIKAHLSGPLKNTLIGRTHEDGSFFLYHPTPGVNGVHEVLSLDVDDELYPTPESQRDPISVKVSLKRFIEQVPAGVNYGELAQHLFDHFQTLGFQVTDVQIDDVAPIYHFHISFAVPVWGPYFAKVTMTLRA